MQQFDKVRLRQQYTRIINDSMKDYIEINKDRVYIIERTLDGSVKLFKVDFWITEDLLELI